MGSLDEVWDGVVDCEGVSDGGLRTDGLIQGLCGAIAEV